MDLLGSILSKMDRPPPVSEKERLEKRRQAEMVKKMQEEEREKLKCLKQGVDEVIDDFLQNTSQTRLKMEPMEKIARKIVHEAADSVGLVAHTFGEGESRYIMLFKKEATPCDAELSCLRSGKEWDGNRTNSREEVYEVPLPTVRRKRAREASPDAYRKKYERIVGPDGMGAAKVTVTKNCFGYVPTENKKDSRSIEQTLADIRAKKLAAVNGNKSENPSTSK